MKFTPACFQCQVEFLSRTLLSSFSWYIRSNCKKIGRLHYFSSVFLLQQAAFRAARCCIFFIRFELLLFHLRNLCILSLLQMRSACWIISLTRKNTIQNSKKLEENTHSPPPKIKKRWRHYWMVRGSWFFLFLCFCFAFWIISLCQFDRKRSENQKRQKNKLKFAVCTAPTVSHLESRLPGDLLVDILYV